MIELKMYGRIKKQLVSDTTLIYLLPKQVMLFSGQMNRIYYKNKMR